MLWFIWLGGFNMPQLHPNTIKRQIKKCSLETKKITILVYHSILERKKITILVYHSIDKENWVMCKSFSLWLFQSHAHKSNHGVNGMQNGISYMLQSLK